jgi:hypothetical protein
LPAFTFLTMSFFLLSGKILVDPVSSCHNRLPSEYTSIFSVSGESSPYSSGERFWNWTASIPNNKWQWSLLELKYADTIYGDATEIAKRWYSQYRVTIQYRTDTLRVWWSPIEWIFLY